MFLRETQDTIWLGQDQGELGVEKSSIRKMRRETTPDAEFMKRQRALAPDGDADGHWALAQWAEENGLSESANTEARTALRYRRNLHAARNFLVSKGFNNADDFNDVSPHAGGGGTSPAPESTAPVKNKKRRLTPGAGVVVFSNDGRELSGAYLRESDGTVWVSVDQGEAGVPRSAIVKINLQDTPDSEFLERRANLKTKDYSGRYELVQWAQKAGLEESANLAAREMLRDNPRSEAAYRFLSDKGALPEEYKNVNFQNLGSRGGVLK